MLEGAIHLANDGSGLVAIGTLASCLAASTGGEPLVPAHIVSLGIALGVGLLVGLERERHPDTVAGVRTFGLAGLVGGLAAFLTPAGSTPWPLVALAALAGIFGTWGGIAARQRTDAREGVSARRNEATANDARANDGMRDIGLTTAFALVATTLLGGYAMIGDRGTTLVAAGTLFLLLYLREPLHAMIRRLGEEDVRAIATFVLIALVILPVLPNRDMGPFDAINPRTAWMLVVLVVSLSLVGYIAQSLLGDRAGTVATGLLGGLVSSTATTAGAARRAREDGQPHIAAATALLACGVLPLRIVVLVALISKELFAATALPLVAIGIVTLLGGVIVLRRATADSSGTRPRPRNPTQLRPALTFAAIFVLISIATKGALEYGDASAFLVVAGVSGITDMDAIALSTAREVERGTSFVLGAQAVLVALGVNTMFKLAIARVSGNAQMFKLVLPPLGIAVLIAIAGAIFA